MLQEVQLPKSLEQWDILNRLSFLGMPVKIQAGKIMVDIAVKTMDENPSPIIVEELEKLIIPFTSRNMEPVAKCTTSKCLRRRSPLYSWRRPWTTEHRL